MTWTEALETRLVQAWNVEGATASEIGARLGKTRNAIVGKVHRDRERLKLVERGDWHHSNRLGIKRVNRVKHKPQPAREIKPPCSPPSIWGSLFDAGELDCKWPIGETDGLNTRCCNAKRQAGSTYCPYHHAVAYSGKVAAGVKPSRARP